MSELIKQARKDRAAAEAAGDLGLVVFIDGFIAGATEMMSLAIDTYGNGGL